MPHAAGTDVRVEDVGKYAWYILLSVLTFTALTNIDTVDVNIYRKAPLPDTGTVFRNIAVSPDNPSVQISGREVTWGNNFCYNLQAGSKYWWQIRFRDTVNRAGLCSAWSEIRTFKVGVRPDEKPAGPALTSPALGATEVSPNSVGFTWAPVSGATEYEVIIATDANLTEAVAGTPVNVSKAVYKATGLEYERTYFWSVRVTRPVESVYTIGTFTTTPEPETQPTITRQVESTVPADGTPVSTGIPLFIWGLLAIGVLPLILLLLYHFFIRRD